MRGLGLAAAVVLFIAAPAHASYLHMAKARPGAQTYVSKVAVPIMGATGGTLGRCWHTGPHTVLCSFTVTGVDVCDTAQDVCELPLSGEPPPSHWFAVIAQRRGGLVGHTLWLGNYDWL